MIRLIGAIIFFSIIFVMLLAAVLFAIRWAWRAIRSQEYRP